MSVASYMGIPRDQIPWGPEIRAEDCSGCQTCIDTCPNEVLVFDEQTARAAVVNPLNCVVLCDKCAQLCPEDAIVFPDKAKFRQLLTKLGDRWRKSN